MPRQARIKSESGIYHIMLRGINKQVIFEDEEDNLGTQGDGSLVLHGSGYYGHYHDKKHVIHIWYGEPIGYQR